MKKFKEVERTCMVCRKKINKGELTRIVRTKEGEVLIDKTGKINGRGAYICESSNCLNVLIKKELLSKNFKLKVSKEFYLELEEYLNDRGKEE